MLVLLLPVTEHQNMFKKFEKITIRRIPLFTFVQLSPADCGGTVFYIVFVNNDLERNFTVISSIFELLCGMVKLIAVYLI